jgi:hypothetical protein
MALTAESPKLGTVCQCWKYLGRIKIKDKIFRESLEAAIFINAKLRLGD